jgi:crossover junction endodeoxyribonuclease RusA
VIQIPWPPSLNAYYRKFRNHMVIAEAGRKYREAIKELIGPVTPRTQRLAVVMILCPPDRRRRDVDNFAKCVFDAFTKAGVWVDDSQIDFLCISRGGIVKDGVIFLAISDMEVIETEGLELVNKAATVAAQATPRGREAGGVESKARRSSADAGSEAQALIPRSTRSRKSSSSNVK